MNDKEWLQNLKVGDRVIVVGSGLSKGTSISTVIRFTKNFIVIGTKNYIGNIYETKFRKESGWDTGEGYYHSHLKEATPEAIAALLLKVKQANIQKYVVSKVNWSIVPKDVIERVYEILDPFVKEDKEVK